jgi:hypothetical protein
MSRPRLCRYCGYPIVRPQPPGARPPTELEQRIGCILAATERRDFAAVAALLDRWLGPLTKRERAAMLWRVRLARSRYRLEVYLHHLLAAPRSREPVP